MDRGSRRCNKASRENCKKKPKEICKGATKDKEESQQNNKEYDRCLLKKNSQRQNKRKQVIELNEQQNL